MVQYLLGIFSHIARLNKLILILLKTRPRAHQGVEMICFVEGNFNSPLTRNTAQEILSITAHLANYKFQKCSK